MKKIITLVESISHMDGIATVIAVAIANGVSSLIATHLATVGILMATPTTVLPPAP
jgi:hypothetical protein